MLTEQQITAQLVRLPGFARISREQGADYLRIARKANSSVHLAEAVDGLVDSLKRSALVSDLAEAIEAIAPRHWTPRLRNTCALCHGVRYLSHAVRVSYQPNTFKVHSREDLGEIKGILTLSSFRELCGADQDCIAESRACPACR